MPIKPNHIYLIHMYKEDLPLNNLHLLICHKTQPNQTKPNHIYLICMYKQDLALNNLEWLICHKNQTKPETKHSCSCRTSSEDLTHNSSNDLKKQLSRYYSQVGFEQKGIPINLLVCCLSVWCNRVCVEDCRSTRKSSKYFRRKAKKEF